MTRHRDTSGPQGSVYTHPRTGEQFPSVTTIIGGGLPKHALVPWAAKVVAEHAAGTLPCCEELAGVALVKHLKGLPNAERDRRAAEGSAVHRAIEAHAAAPADFGPLGDLSEEEAKLAGTWARWFSEYRPVFHGNELTVVNRRLGYAGTLDALVELPGWPGLGVVDWKTGKAVYSDVGLQLAAYRHAEVVMDDDGSEWPMPKVAWAAVLRLDPVQDLYEFKPVDAGAQTLQSFLDCMGVRRFAQRTDVIGPRIATPQEVEEASPEDRALYRELMHTMQG